MADIPKVQRNIRRMIDGGASEQEIDAYLQHEGVSIEELQGPAAPQAMPREPSQAGSFLDPLMQGVTLGAADEIRGGLRGGARYLFGDNPGKSLGDLYGEELQGSRENLAGFRERHPIGAPALEVGGAGLGVLGTGGTSLVPRVASTAGKIGMGILEGAGLGGLYGFNAGEGGARERLESAAVSAPFGAAGGAVGGAIGAAMTRGPRVAASSLDDLSAASTAAFDSMRSSGVVVRPRKTDQVVDAVLKVAVRKRINDTLHPDSYARLQDVLELRGSSPSVADLHELRQIVAQAAESPKPADRKMAVQLLEAMDEQIDNLNAFDVTGPDPKAAVASLREGMDTWHRFRKAQVIAKIFSDAELDAAGKFTQAGMNQALINGFKSLAKNEKRLRGFSKEERQAIRDVVAPGGLQRVMRMLGKYAPTSPLALASGQIGGGSIGTGIGYMAGDPMLGYIIGSSVPAAGAIARGISTRATQRAATNVDEMVRRGGPARPKKPLSKAQQAELAMVLGAGMPVGSMLDRQFR